MVMSRMRECLNCAECEIRSPIFRHFDQEELHLMNRDRFVVNYQPGELIFKQGSQVTHLVMVISGLVKAFIEGESKNLILWIAKPYEVVMGPGLFTDTRHHHSATALTMVEACYIPIGNFRELIGKNAGFAEEVIKDVSSHSLFSFRRMMSLTQKQVPGRVAEALLYFSGTIYNNSVFELNLSRQELADFCGSTKESAIRVLKEFKDESFIRVEGNRFEILDEHMIRKISALG